MGNQYDPGESHSNYVMMQAGFPGYSQQYGSQYVPALPVNAGYANAYAAQGLASGLASGYGQPEGHPGYAQSAIQPGQSIAQQLTPQQYQQQCQQYQNQMIAAGYGQGYGQGCGQGYGQSYGQPQPLAAPARIIESEAVIQERIKANIDAIMETQKTALLNSKLESLTNKVQSLTQNMEMEGSGSKIDSQMGSQMGSQMSSQMGSQISSHMKTLSDRVDRLSRSIESNSTLASPARPAAAESSNTLSSGDSDIARRLRRLAAESSAKRADERIPDW